MTPNGTTDGQNDEKDERVSKTRWGGWRQDGNERQLTDWKLVGR